MFAKVMDHKEVAAINATFAKDRAERIARRAAENIPTPVADTDIQIAEIRQSIEKLSLRDRDANRRLKVHVILIIISIALGSVTPIIPALVPLAGVFAGIPTIVQEVTDWIKGW